jgi:hypothetical protein
LSCFLVVVASRQAYCERLHAIHQYNPAKLYVVFDPAEEDKDAAAPLKASENTVRRAKRVEKVHDAVLLLAAGKSKAGTRTRTRTTITNTMCMCTVAHRPPWWRLQGPGFPTWSPGAA